MFNLKWMFANQGLNQDDPAQFENMFTHVIICWFAPPSLFIPYKFHSSKTEIRILLELKWTADL